MTIFNGESGVVVIVGCRYLGMIVFIYMDLYDPLGGIDFLYHPFNYVALKILSK